MVKKALCEDFFDASNRECISPYGSTMSEVFQPLIGFAGDDLTDSSLSKQKKT